MKLLDVDFIYDSYDKWLKGKERRKLQDIAASIHSFYLSASSETLLNLCSEIDEAVHFYRGNHYLDKDKYSGRFRIRERNVFNQHIPRRSTPYLTREVESIVSLLTRNKEKFAVVENSPDAKDKNKAKIGDAILEGSYILNNELFNKIRMVKLAVMCGTVYRKDYFDPRIITYDSKGRIIYGETRTKMLSPLDIIPDYNEGLLDIDDGRYALEFGYYPVSYIKENYKGKEDGYTGYIDGVAENSTSNMQLDYLQELKDPLGTSAAGVEKNAILLELYLRPNLTHPKGLMIVCTNRDILYINENKAFIQFGGRFWSPYTMARYLYDPFSHYGIGLPKLIIPLNKAINRIDNLIEINRATMVSPRVVAQQGSLSENQSISGNPQNILEYKPGFDKPNLEFGRPLDQSVMQERAMLVEEISKMSGSNEVLQGIRPTGVSTTSGLNLLLEQAYSQFNIFNFGLENALSRAYTKVLNLKRYCYKEKRDNYFNRIKAINSSLTDVAIEDFFNDNDLGNNIDVRIEQGSTKPTSAVMEKQYVKESIELGILGGVTPQENPLGSKYILGKLGLSDFNTPTNKDVTRAEWENDLIRTGRHKEVVVMPVDNNIIHYMVLNDEIKKPEFYSTNTMDVIEYFWKHLCEHFQSMTPEQYQVVGLDPTQIEELDTMSLKFEIITMEELAEKRGFLNDQMQQDEQMPEDTAMVGDDPNMQAVPMQEGVYPDDSMEYDMGAAEDINSSGMM